jgi:hypothetical protein
MMLYINIEVTKRLFVERIEIQRKITIYKKSLFPTVELILY